MMEANMRYAKDDAAMQDADKEMATRILENGIKINIRIGDVVVPATLNDSETARAFAEKPPLSLKMNNSGLDFCGILPEALPYEAKQVHNGWLNGDIDFATDGNWLAILYAGEEKFETYGHQVNRGKVDCELSRLADLDGTYQVHIELAKE